MAFIRKFYCDKCKKVTDHYDGQCNNCYCPIKNNLEITINKYSKNMKYSNSLKKELEKNKILI